MASERLKRDMLAKGESSAGVVNMVLAREMRVERITKASMWRTPLASSRMNLKRVLAGTPSGGTFLNDELAKARRAEIEAERSLWPTPVAINRVGRESLRKGRGGSGPFLHTALMKLRQVELEGERALFPTPVAFHWGVKGKYLRDEKRQGQGGFLSSTIKKQNKAKSGLFSRRTSPPRSVGSSARGGGETVAELLARTPNSELLPNPDLLCWLMGFPEGWCSSLLGSTETPSYRTSSRPLAGRSSRCARPRITKKGRT
jgi:hypothetical protein